MIAFDNLDSWNQELNYGRCIGTFVYICGLDGKSSARVLVLIRLSGREQSRNQDKDCFAILNANVRITVQSI